MDPEERAMIGARGPATILSVLALIMTACGGGTVPSPSAAPSALTSPGAPAQERADIVYWSHENEPRNELDRKLIAEFTTQNPDIKVTYETFPFEDYETKVVTALAGGTGPQVFNLFTSRMAGLVTSKAVVPVDFKAMGLADDAAFRDLYVPNALDGFTFDGVIYAIPTEASNMVLYVNKAKLAEAGLDQNADIPRTWEQVREVSQKMVRRDGSRLTQRGFEFTYGGDIDIPVLAFETMAYQRGGGVLDPASGAVIIDQPPAVEALRYWYDWVYTDKLGDPALGETTEAFCDGTVAMTTVAQWFTAWLKENCPELTDVTVVPFPRFADGERDSGAFLFAYGHLVNAAASPAQQAAAWSLASFLASRPGDYLVEASMLQPRKEIQSSDALAQVEFGDVFFAELQASPYDQLSFETWEAVQRAIERSTQNQIDPAESLGEAKPEIEGILAN